ncbi:MAG: hypothetical protein IKL54_00670 [Bacteroidaceae bacterium]|nr:hypothetical protein [Bacteroidaceae bacterium]
MKPEEISPTKIFTLVLFLFAIIAYIFVFNNEYKDGKTPNKNADEYLVYMNDKVFTSVVNEQEKGEDKTLLKVVDSSKKKLQLYVSDSAKFASKLKMLANLTIREFEGYGFEWGEDEQGNYFSLPREKGWNEDYVITPVWLVSLLVDNGVIDTNEEIIKNDDMQKWWLFIAVVVVFLIIIILKPRTKKEN